MDETSDVSKLEQFGISVSYLDCKGAKQERFLKFTEVKKTEDKQRLSQQKIKISLNSTASNILWEPL